MPSRSQMLAASTTHLVTQLETSTSAVPTSTAEVPPGAPCTNNDQCIAPNICYTSTAASKAFCCGTTVLGCPGASCSMYQDCLDPYGCVSEVGTCCGWGPTTVLVGTTCYTSS
ncbi:hypothetical protein N431DRAFT_118291 [Stipitochalara longipes BDJ]|nr:hypothetical protein N431DRAFT_118291 [Stipitochalara longipes BDJ]